MQQRANSARITTRSQQRQAMSASSRPGEPEATSAGGTDQYIGPVLVSTVEMREAQQPLARLMSDAPLIPASSDEEYDREALGPRCFFPPRGDAEQSLISSVADEIDAKGTAVSQARDGEQALPNGDIDPEDGGRPIFRGKIPQGPVPRHLQGYNEPD